MVVFYALTAVFIFLLCQFFIPGFNEVLKGTVFLAPMIIFALLGGALLFLTLKKKVKKPLKTYLMLTGASSAGFFVFVFLHNFFYALGIIFENLSFLFEILHATSFIISVVVAPVLFIAGVIGVFWIDYKK